MQLFSSMQEFFHHSSHKLAKNSVIIPASTYAVIFIHPASS